MTIQRVIAEAHGDGEWLMLWPDHSVTVSANPEQSIRQADAKTVRETGQSVITELVWQ